MDEETQEDALHRAAELVGDALKETEARCGVLAHYIGDCEAKGSRTGAFSEAVRELRTLQDRRAGLMRRHKLIQEALDCAVGARPEQALLPTLPDSTATRTQRQVQIQVKRRPQRRS